MKEDVPEDDRVVTDVVEAGTDVDGAETEGGTGGEAIAGKQAETMEKQW